MPPPSSSITAIQYVVTGAGLGMAFGMAVAYALVKELTPMSMYTMIYSVFFFGEFITIATYQAARVTPRSFLIWGNDGSLTSWLARSFGWLEYWWWQRQWSSTRLVVGSAIAVCGLGWRWLAMAQCGDSFNHTVEHVKRQGHRLRTTGLYSVMRHPSYFGILLLEVGTQVVLGNRLMMVGGFMGTALFFALRVKREERGLVEMYGQAYQQYQARVPSGILIPEWLLSVVPTTGVDTMM